MTIKESNIRNFCIIAHIDHGKSTLADRLLEHTGTVSSREMKAQFLDSMDLERERGITIKLQPVQMRYALEGQDYILNLIDTPGHVDFNYEVSRSLAAVDGAILLVDATQGVQAQTIANLYLALEQNLAIIPVVNKIDLPAADIEKTKEEIIGLLGCKEQEIILTSGKTGQGVETLLNAVVQKIPSPAAPTCEQFRSLIFDSFYDEYKGIVCYVRVFDGEIRPGDKVQFMATAVFSEVQEVGFLKPQMVKGSGLKTGDIGYIITGIKDIEQCRVGDTLAQSTLSEALKLAGYKKVVPMVFVGLFCQNGSDFNKLREALNKLKLNDAALVFEPEHSPALGFGFRCGFLGLLHLDIICERLKREFDLELIITSPSVAYHVKVAKLSNQVIKNIKKENWVSENILLVRGAADFPDPAQIEQVLEPVMSVDIVSPESYIGAVMSLVQEKRGVYLNTEYLSGKVQANRRVVLHYRIPLATLIVDFYDKLKSVTSGYASLFYEYFGHSPAEVVKLDLLINTEEVEALSSLVYKDDAYYVGRKLVKTLKDILPRQMFEVKIQAALGSKVIASERISPYRKDVTAKLYGGDYTRRMKLLEKQKKGKKKMLQRGKVSIPTEVFLQILKK